MGSKKNIILTCKHCGKLFIGRLKSTQYCSRRCRYASEEKDIDRSCHFNEAVVCKKKQCGACGWNPEVAQKRSEIILRKLEEEWAKTFYSGKLH